MLGQVDCKFIACVLPPDADGRDHETLLLVDQHAADERIGLERLVASVHPTHRACAPCLAREP